MFIISYLDGNTYKFVDFIDFLYENVYTVVIFFEEIYEGGTVMITFAEDIKDVSIYLSLRQQVGWVSLTKEQAQQALDHSLKIITVYDDECPIGMGRIVGDGAVICYIQD